MTKEWRHEKVANKQERTGECQEHQDVQCSVIVACDVHDQGTVLVRDRGSLPKVVKGEHRGANHIHVFVGDSQVLEMSGASGDAHVLGHSWLCATLRD